MYVERTTYSQSQLNPPPGHIQMCVSEWDHYQGGVRYNLGIIYASSVRLVDVIKGVF